MEFDLEPVLIKQEHSGGSIGLHHFTSAGDARAFVARYRFRPTESLIMQEVVAGATRDMRVTIVGDRAITSASYWRVKSPEALSRPEWTPTATRYNTRVDHADIPAAAVAVAVDCLRRLDVRTAGVDLIWPGDDVTASPLILEFSPYYQPNPPKPQRYQHLSYKAFKTNWPAPGGYLERQFFVFRDIASQILDQGLF
jgi:glutathione synthase/RimK-type ligase-like ATP-grasp enzyme